MEKISTYILTKNSQKYLEEILEKVHSVSDEILVIDSGSTDKTEKICRGCPKVNFIFNKFENFKQQRLFAERKAANDFIFFVDCDEIPDQELISAIWEKKENGFESDAYTVQRNWHVLGKYVRSIYPLPSPDFPIRLYNRRFVSFKNAKTVHEAPTGYRNKEVIQGAIKHITFETEEELQNKLHFYTDIAAREYVEKDKTVNLFKVIVNPIAAYIKFYIMKKGFLDGAVGIKLGNYAFNYNRLKYLKAYRLKRKK